MSRRTTDSETRRQAASDFTRALMEQFESQVTAIVTQYVGAYLQVSLLRLFRERRVGS